MNINTKNIVSMTEANQNFSKVARLADSTGTAVIFKNNKPKYVLLDIEQSEYFDLTDGERIEIISKRILERHKDAFKELAK